MKVWGLRTKNAAGNKRRTSLTLDEKQKRCHGGYWLLARRWVSQETLKQFFENQQSAIASQQSAVNGGL
jgi:predicted Rdx family selenoprotein